MFALFGVSGGLLTIAVVAEPEAAEAHVYNCGHGAKTVYLDTPGGIAEFREAYVWGSGITPHRHVYRVFRWQYGKWSYVHSHERTCAYKHPI